MRAPRTLVDAFGHLRDPARLNVALVFSGNPKNPVNTQRSLPVGALEPLLEMEDVHWVSLQKGPARHQLTRLSRDLPDLGAQCHDFADTAAVLGHMDLVITVCTSVAHLAGVMGKPVWILLHDDADWRWHLDTSVSPWYPTARLFRQSQPGDWSGVIRRVAEALATYRQHRLSRPLETPELRRRRDRVTVRRLQTQAIGCLRRQEWSAALAAADQALALEPASGRLHLTRAVALERLQRPRLAQRSYRDALQQDPTLVAAWHNLAVLQQQQGQVDQALATCLEGLRHLPQAALLFHCLGYLYNLTGRDDEAEQAYRRARQLDPKSAESANHLGVVLARRGQWDEAVCCYREALALDPDYAEAANNHGLALRHLGRLDEAQAQFRQALMLQPQFAEAHYNLAGLLHQMGRFDQAVIHCHRALKLKPAYAPAFNQLGITLQAQGQWDAARQAHEQAVRLNPEDPEFNNNLAIVLRQQEHFAHAECHYLKAIAREPTFSQAHYNLGNLYQEWGRFDDAVRAYDRALTLEPDYADAHWNRGLVKLRCGDWAAGWQDYQWRHQTDWAATLYPHRTDRPRWRGGPLQGQRLLVVSEQGLGDTLQMVRFLPLLKARGATVILETWPALADLLRDAPGVDELAVIQADHPYPGDFDQVVWIMDLPAALGVRLEDLPVASGYLPVEQPLVTQWRQRLRSRRPKVGLVWAGSPGHGNDHRRSMPLSLWTPILERPEITCFSLQKGPAADQLEDIPLPHRPADLGRLFRDFRDTAHAVAALDLVISVDTACAHLAGALGRPVWVLLPALADWRWLTDRSDSPWYPSMRLIRQSRHDDWGPVIQRVTADLAAWSAQQRSRQEIS